MTADVSQLEHLAAELVQASGRLGASTADTVRKTARKVQRAAKQNAPRDTGLLAESIGIDLIGDGRSTEMTAFVGSAVFYGRFLEHGTARMEPKPFLGPALAANRSDFERSIGDDIDKAI